MLKRRIIPCLDVRDGRVVKGVRFADLRDSGDPAECTRRYERDGADEIVMLDIAATPQRRGTHLKTVRALRRVLSIPLTVGGGVRCEADALALLEAGADKVAMNTAAVLEPELITTVAKRFGSQCAVIAIDATWDEDAWKVVTQSGAHRTERDAISWAREAVDRGAGEVLLTSWDQDGSGDGYDLNLIEQVSEAVGVPVIASGGAAGVAHIVDAFRAGADAALAASIFHDGVYSVCRLKRELEIAGIEVRT